MEWSEETMLPVCEEVLPWIHEQSHESVLELHTLLSLSGVYGAHPTLHSTAPTIHEFTGDILL
jgi:hypothetical protein